MSQAAPTETNEQYHADTKHVSASMLKALRESPRIFEARYVTRTMESKQTPAMQIGSAVHCLALEPELFGSRYVLNPHRDKRTKAYKEWAEGLSGQEVLNESDWSTVNRCADALRKVPLIKKFLESEGCCEHSVRHIDAETGVPCKVRADKVFFEQRIILDIKTIQECSDKKIRYACDDFGYHIQDAHYRSVIAQSEGDEIDAWKFVFAFVETSEPFRSRAIVLDHPSSTLGFEERFRLLTEYQDRMESGDWSEPNEQEITEITIQSVYRKRNE